MCIRDRHKAEQLNHKLHTEWSRERARDFDLTGKCDCKRDRKCSTWRMRRRFAAVLLPRSRFCLVTQRSSTLRIGKERCVTRDETKTAAWEIRSVREEEYRVILFLLAWPNWNLWFVEQNCVMSSRHLQSGKTYRKKYNLIWKQKKTFGNDWQGQILVIFRSFPNFYLKTKHS